MYDAEGAAYRANQAADTFDLGITAFVVYLHPMLCIWHRTPSRIRKMRRSRGVLGVASASDCRNKWARHPAKRLEPDTPVATGKKRPFRKLQPQALHLVGCPFRSQ